MGIRRAFDRKYFSSASWLILIVTLSETLAANENWALTKYDVKNVKYQWEIINYSANGRGFGQILPSPRFFGNDSKTYRWQLHLYPKGREGSKDYVGLYLVSHNKQPLTVDAKMSLIDNKGKAVKTLKIVKRRMTQNNGLGSAEFILTRDLEYYKKGSYLPNDKLTLKVDLTFGYRMIRVASQCSIINTEKCTSLPFNSSFLADLDLYVDGEVLKAHKAALKAHSSWFKGELEFRPTATSLSLGPNVKPDVMKAALRFIYTGKTDASVAMLKKLLELSDIFALTKLKLYCEEQLCKKMTSKSASEMLEIAKLNNAVNLKREAENFMLGYNEITK